MAAIVLRWRWEEPVVPFQQLLADGLYAGEMLVMHGSVSQDADRFHVNFTCRDRKSESYDDVAFHFNPRFKRSGCIVCNTLQEEKWGREEITYKMPFEKGKLFKAIFLVFSDNFQVAVNDKHLLQYNHRINLEKVNEIAVYGNVKLRSIECLSLTGKNRRIVHLVVPYVETIHGGLNAGEMVVIHGSVSQDADKFEVDFQCGGSNTPCCNIPFHFNPRFNPSECIVCNTLAGGKWGTEEITYEMPFEKGKPFKAIFFVFSDNFQVAVNDKHLLLYNHRINLEKVDTLGIYGNVKVQSIEFVSMTGENSRIAPLAKKAAGKPLISGKPFKPAHQGPDKHKDRGKDSQRSQPDKHTRRVSFNFRNPSSQQRNHRENRNFREPRLEYPSSPQRTFPGTGWSSRYPIRENRGTPPTRYPAPERPPGIFGAIAKADRPPTPTPRKLAKRATHHGSPGPKTQPSLDPE